jgi:hypothetical protein
MSEPTFSDPQAYVARWGRSALLAPALMVLVAVLVVVGAAASGSSLLGLVALVFAGLAFVTGRGAWPHVRARTVALGIDARGIYLGPDVVGPPAQEEVPWIAVDAVVHFWERKKTYNSGDTLNATWRRTEYVGVLRQGRIVSRRQVGNWRLDRNALAAAVERFGAGRPLQELPDLDPQGVPRTD